MLGGGVVDMVMKDVHIVEIVCEDVDVIREWLGVLDCKE